MIPDSSAQQSFLRKHKKRQQFIRLMRLAVFLVFLLLWEVSARLGSSIPLSSEAPVRYVLLSGPCF